MKIEGIRACQGYAVGTDVYQHWYLFDLITDKRLIDKLERLYKKTLQ